MTGRVVLVLRRRSRDQLRSEKDNVSRLLSSAELLRARVWVTIVGAAWANDQAEEARLSAARRVAKNHGALGTDPAATSSGTELGNVQPWHPSFVAEVAPF